jgi:hypothetical protein
MALMPIPSNAEPLFTRLHNEVIRLSAFWNTFNDLFLKGHARAELLVESGDFFFLLVQEAFLSHIQLTLSKLTDPAESRGFENATLQRLLNDLATPVPEGIQLQASLDRLKAQCLHIRNRRNQELAHFDLGTVAPRATVSRPRPRIPEPDVAEFAQAIESLHTIMSSIEQYYTNSQTAYSLSVTFQDVGQLLATLKQGLRYSEMVNQRAIPFEDFPHSRYFNS